MQSCYYVSSTAQFQKSFFFSSYGSSSDFFKSAFHILLLCSTSLEHFQLSYTLFSWFNIQLLLLKHYIVHYSNIYAALTFLTFTVTLFLKFLNLVKSLVFFLQKMANLECMDGVDREAWVYTFWRAQESTSPCQGSPDHSGSHPVRCTVNVTLVCLQYSLSISLR